MLAFMDEFKHLEIQPEEIKSATSNFDRTKLIGEGGFGDVYEAEMSLSNGQGKVAIKRLNRKRGQGESEFMKEISTLSRYSHENLISLLGFCNQDGEKILVYEHASRGSLDRHLSSTSLTWTRRIKICLDAARGLSYLHDPRETHQRVLHRDVKSANILLDSKWNAKLSDMGLSKVGPANQQHTDLFTNIAGTPGYWDPQYFETYNLTKESDVYSFGVVLFEVFCGRLCYRHKNGQLEVLVPTWKQSYTEKKLAEIIFQDLRQPMDPTSMETFSDIAFQCLQKSSERPKMSLVVEKLKSALEFQEHRDLILFEEDEEITPLTNYRQKKILSKEVRRSPMMELKNLQIQLADITKATNNFDKTKVIGSGGFGLVYKGEVLSQSKRLQMIAIKRLDHKFGLGDIEFFTEISTLSRFRHHNLISLLGFCDEAYEKILVYEYASNRSLDLSLSDPGLTWTQRLSICLGAAKALSYLHDPNGSLQRVLHRDIKSSNILLDENLNAKVSDFGLAKITTHNGMDTAIYTNVVGTIGYCDPVYMETGMLTKKSDVYSFGVVLFEILCGRLCFENINGKSRIFITTWKQCFQEKNLDAIIFQDLLQPMDRSCLETFSHIAFQCLQTSREERPMMSHVVEKLEIALEFQKLQDLKLQEYDEILKAVIPPLRFKSPEELNQLLSEGVYLYSGKLWLSLNEKGERCVMISMKQCLIPNANEHQIFQYSVYNSRFPVGCYSTTGNKFKLLVRTQFLSPLVTYTVNFVFKFKNGKKESKEQYIALEYKLEGETETSIVYLADEREDEWLMAELYQFTSDGKIVDLEIIFEANKERLVVEGIEFQPLEEVEDKVLADDELDMLTVSDSDDPSWEQKLPNDVEDIISWSKDDVQWKTKKELYSSLCKGFLINNGEEWFSLDKNGKKCHMLSPKAARVITKRNPSCWSVPESRFGEAFVIEYNYLLHLLGDIKSQLVSPETTYACYLVYKLPEDQSKGYQAPVEVRYEDLLDSDDRKVGDSWYIYLVSPQTPVIRPNGNEKAYNPLHRPKIKGLPHERSDGWMEVQVWEFRTTTTTEMIPMRLSLTECGDICLHRLVLQGIEFRPL